MLEVAQRMPMTRGVCAAALEKVDGGKEALERCRTVLNRRVCVSQARARRASSKGRAVMDESAWQRKGPVVCVLSLSSVVVT